MGQTTGVGANPGTAAPAGADSDAQTQSSMSDMKSTFAQAVQQNAEMTKIQTQGNTAKRAASAVPQ